MSRTIDKVAWVHLREGRILSTLSKGRSRYYIPGGKREPGETDLETLDREIREELTVDIIKPSVSFLGVFEAQADAHPDGVQVIMRCYEAEYSGEIKPATEIAKVVWLGYEDRHLSSPVDQIIFEWLHAHGRL
ncbi:NUDIX hydrolase [Nonomuraea sp. SBT364]|uniref:NUDIX hydrolase n=1 Tax=Nonomuraea sp. SBT364 TaxID=1580530 RepID=UPI00066CC217|nr:NUDIX domain-containing protein [Nonomuraea sp. SBT364]